MTKKPVNAGPADKVAVLAAVARKVQRILDDHEMILDYHNGTFLVGSWANDQGGGWTAATVETNPDIVVLRG